MYRKFSADRIFTGYDYLPANKVLITTTAGEIVDITDEADAGDNIEIYAGILTPGFINCHCHLELSHLKSIIPKGAGLVDFVFKIVTERHHSTGEILSAIDTAEKQMYNNGIVAVGDICNNEFTISQKLKNNLWYHNFIETAGFPPAAAATRFQQAVDLFQSFARVLPQNSIVPHAPYSVSPALFTLINNFPGNDVISIHNQETVDENLLFEKREADFLRMFEKMNIDISFFKPSGKTSLQTYLPYLSRSRSLILVHNLSTSSIDIDFANTQFNKSATNLSYCLCPNANLYITGVLPDVNQFIEKNCRIVLGTDSLASNDQLDILAEMKTINRKFPSVKLKQMLGWATINGAKALHCDHIYGSFEKGKRPGIVLIGNIINENIGNAVAKRIL